MATIDLTTGSGLKSKAMTPASSRRVIASALPMTVPPSVTPQTIAAAISPEFAALKLLMAALPADVWAAATRTLTSAPPPTAEVIAEAVREAHAPELAIVASLQVDGSGRVAADLQSVAGQTVSGSGTEADPWGPQA